MSKTRKQSPKRRAVKQSRFIPPTPDQDGAMAERWLLNRMLEQARCSHLKSHDEGGVEYCNACGKSLRVNTYRD